jgi:hypothetical protein
MAERGAVAAVIYAAKSTDDRHGSIPTQIEDCRAAVEREHRELYGEPQLDEGFSGYKRSRGPGLEDQAALRSRRPRSMARRSFGCSTPTASLAATV